jgi:hypothetical protein
VDLFGIRRLLFSFDIDAVFLVAIRRSVSAIFTSFKKQKPGYCFRAVAGPFLTVTRTEALVRFGS